MSDLLEEYRETLRNTKRAREAAPDEEDKIWAGMVGELERAIYWLRTGSQKLPKKSRWVDVSDDWPIEERQCVSLLNPFAADPFDEIDKKIDAERRRWKRG